MSWTEIPWFNTRMADTAHKSGHQLVGLLIGHAMMIKIKIFTG